MTDNITELSGGEGSGFVSDIETTVAPETGGYNPNDLQKAWGGYLAVASMVPNVTFLILNGLFGHKFRTQPRLIISLVFVILMFTFTSIMVQVCNVNRCFRSFSICLNRLTRTPGSTPSSWSPCSLWFSSTLTPPSSKVAFSVLLASSLQPTWEQSSVVRQLEAFLQAGRMSSFLPWVLLQFKLGFSALFCPSSSFSPLLLRMALPPGLSSTNTI